MRTKTGVAINALLAAVFVIGSMGLGALAFGSSGTSVAAPSAECGGSHGSDGGGGANQSGPYDSTCDGSPSQNGNGNGKANGRPCAGCVGNADDKNPPGQLPNGADPNAGYECDTNHGIGRTNPAHSGCEPAGG